MTIQAEWRGEVNGGIQIMDTYIIFTNLVAGVLVNDALCAFVEVFYGRVGPPSPQSAVLVIFSS